MYLQDTGSVWVTSVNYKEVVFTTAPVYNSLGSPAIRLILHHKCLAAIHSVCLGLLLDLPFYSIIPKSLNRLLPILTGATAPRRVVALAKYMYDVST